MLGLTLSGECTAAFELDGLIKVNATPVKPMRPNLLVEQYHPVSADEYRRRGAVPIAVA
jgi:hypothetical protein